MHRNVELRQQFCFNKVYDDNDDDNDNCDDDDEYYY